MVELDALAELAEQDNSEPWTYAARLLRFNITPEYQLPEGTKMLKVEDAIVREEIYASAHKPQIKGLGGQSFLVVISKDPLRTSWGVPAAELSMYHHTYREWISIDVPLDYPIRTIIEEERIKCERILKNTNGGTFRNFGGAKFKGNKSGRGMMEAWGYYFEKFIREPGGRAKIVAAMVSEFPERELNVIKWVDSYKSYYNLGRLPGTKPQAIKLDFIESLEIQADPLFGLE